VTTCVFVPLEIDVMDGIECLTMTTTIHSPEMRSRLGELLEQSFYQQRQFRIVRKNKPMARLVSEPFMQALEHMMASDPALAETLEILANKEMMEAIEQGTQDIAQKNLFPLEATLEP
jgi:hypothetical protein